MKQDGNIAQVLAKKDEKSRVEYAVKDLMG